MKSKKPLVSVIMPCYNHEKYVGEAIESVLRQTYPNIELIVLDNGSTDGSYKEIVKYADRINTILQLEENDLFQSSELLRAHCSGEYIAFMTSDDLWLPTKIEKQMKAFEEQDNLGACFTWANVVDENLNLIAGPEKNVFGEHNRDRYEWLERVIMGGNCFSYPSAIVKRECYYRALAQSIPFYQLGDEYTWLLILLERNIYVVEEALTCFRWHTRGANCNMSAPNRDSSIRTNNEGSIIIANMIDVIQDDIFLKVFHKYMRNSDVTSHEEVLCEKLFLLMLIAEKDYRVEQKVIEFYYKHNKYVEGVGYPFINTLKRKYNYSYMDFQKYSASRGVGSIDNRIENCKKMEDIIQNQQLRLTALNNVIKQELDEQKQKMIRSNVYKRLPENSKELLGMLVEFLQNIFDYINESSDVVLQNGLPQIIANVCGLQGVLQTVWEEILCYDYDMDETEWKKNLYILNNNEMSVEEFCDFVIPFLAKLYGVLQQYCY